MFHINFSLCKAYHAAPAADDTKSEDAKIRSGLENANASDMDEDTKSALFVIGYVYNSVNISTMSFLLEQPFKTQSHFFYSQNYGR